MFRRILPSLLAATATAAIAQPYDLIVLDLLDPGHQSSEALGVNSSGQVVGISGFSAGRAFFFEDLNGDGVVDAGEFVEIIVFSAGAVQWTRATDINEAGTFVGHGNYVPPGLINGQQFPYVGTDPNTVTTLPVVFEPNNTPRQTWADAINDHDVISGGGYRTLLSVGALIWATPAVMPMLISDVNNTNERAFGLNNNGWAVGRRKAGDPPHIPTGFIYDGLSPGVEVWPPSPAGWSELNDINDSNVAVGRFQNDPAWPGAFRFENGVPINLPPLRPNDFSNALAINNAGVAVGWSKQLRADRDAVIWDANGVVTNLNDFVDPAANVHLLQANDISENGIIVGQLKRLSDNFLRAFVLVPPIVPPCGPADFNGDGVLDVFDVFLFLADYDNGACTGLKGDFNGDGACDVFDVFGFLADYDNGLGCP